METNLRVRQASRLGARRFSVLHEPTPLRIKPFIDPVRHLPAPPGPEAKSTVADPSSGNRADNEPGIERAPRAVSDSVLSTHGSARFRRGTDRDRCLAHF